jgi:predicted DNA-binding protein
MDARLDARTRAKVDDLATRFHQSRAAVVRHIMSWGLNHGWPTPWDQDASHGPVCHLYVYVDAALQKHVAKAATAAGGTIAAWVRQMVRQITLTDFPASWQEARAEARSHDSRRYGTRFMLRLDTPSQTKLQQLVQQFGVSQATIIRQLIAHAMPDAFPQSWHTRAAERRAQQSRIRGMDKAGRPRPAPGGSNRGSMRISSRRPEIHGP